MVDRTVSVIIPIFNVETYLRQCLESVLAQDGCSLEVLCVNDGSTDSSLAIMQEFAERDGRIRIIDKPNEGYGASCNRGIDEATGHWIAIVEPDDWIEPGMYTSMLDYADEFDAEPDIVKTPYWRVIDPDTPQQLKINCSYRARVPQHRLFALGDGVQIIEHHPSIWSAIYRRDYLLDRDIHFKPIPGAGWADNPFLVETLCQTDRICYLDRPFYCYREETEEKTRTFAEKSTFVPIQRWHDMKDVLDRLQVTDERILRAHIHRGFTYLAGIYTYIGTEREDIREAARSVYERMEYDIIASDPEIPPFDLRVYADVMGVEVPRDNRLAFAGVMVGRGMYFLVNAGLRYTARMTKNIIIRDIIHKR